MFSRALALVAILPLFGCVTVVEGYVSARGAKTLPSPLTFTMFPSSGLPTLEEQTINSCIESLLVRLGARAVGTGDEPAAVVAFTFDNGGAPIGYRAKTSSPWPEERNTSVTSVYGRRFRLLMFDGTAERPLLLWEAEVRSSGT